MFMTDQQQPDTFGASCDFVLDDYDASQLLSHYFSTAPLHNMTALDAGCRTGEFAAELARRGAKVTGVDLSARCINEARKRHPKIDFKVVDIRSLADLGDHSFDLVLCLGVMCYLKPSEWDSTLRELARLCKADGRLLILFQYQRSWLAHAVVAIVSALPLWLYLRVVCPIAAAILSPLSGLIMGSHISRGAVRYRLLLSLRNLQFGFPEELSPHLSPVPNSKYASPDTTCAFFGTPAQLETALGYRSSEVPT
jgi:SAM-dependent methyltransferase